MKDKVFAYIKNKYKALPEYLWKKYPDFAVFRHTDNNKWFALQAAVPGNKLGLITTSFMLLMIPMRSTGSREVASRQEILSICMSDHRYLRLCISAR